MGTKLAVIALVLAGCVAEEPTSSTSAHIEGGEVGATGAEVELPSAGPDHVNPDLVVITGLEIPGQQPTQVHIDVSNVDVADASLQVRDLCAAAAELPQSNVCSSLCTGSGAAARLIGDTTPSCDTTRCELADGVVVNVDVCVD